MQLPKSGQETITEATVNPVPVLNANAQAIEEWCPFRGNGSPEGVVEAPVGSLYLRQDGGAGTVFYVKESGVGSTGWVAK
jgi:hypothetical protein